jgi:hypothetical protein
LLLTILEQKQNPFSFRKLQNAKKYISLPERKKPFDLSQKKASRPLENGGDPLKTKNP